MIDGKVLWTPTFGGNSCDFSIYLDRTFARNMFQSKTSSEKQHSMNHLGNDILNRHNINWNNPYRFEGDTCFIPEFYIGNGGVWLSTDRFYRESLAENSLDTDPIVYHTHNVDNDSNQAFALMRLFHRWIDYSEILPENNSSDA